MTDQATAARRQAWIDQLRGKTPATPAQSWLRRQQAGQLPAKELTRN